MKKLLVLILLILTIIPSFGIAEDKALWIDGVNLSLGMKKERVFDSFNKNHDLKKVGDSDNYIIYKKDLSSPSNVVGQVAFKSGKLIFASQTWGSFSAKESCDLANSLYSAINGILDSGDKALSIKTETKRSPEMTLSTIEFKFSNKVVIVSIADGRNVVKSVVVQENMN